MQRSGGGVLAVALAIAFSISSSGVLSGCADDPSLASLVPQVRTVTTAENTPVDVKPFDDTSFEVFSASADPHKVEIIDGSTLRITPATGFAGSFDVRYAITDSEHAEVDEHLMVSVTPAAPLTAAALDLSFHAKLAIHLAAQPAHGDVRYIITKLPLRGVLSGDAPNISYTPSDPPVDDSFTYIAIDTVQTSQPATVQLHYSEGSAPTAGEIDVAVDEDSARSISVFSAASDPDGDLLTYRVASQPSHGTLTVSLASAFYQPAPNYNGPDSFDYEVSDGLHTSRGTVNITVQPVNDAPVAVAQTVNTNEDTPTSITLTGSDVDGDTLTFSLSTNPAHGSLTGSGASWTYTPFANFHGDDQFRFSTIDPGFFTSSATVTIHVAPVDDGPVAASFSATAAEDTPTSITLQGSDIDGDPVSDAVVDAPSHGTLSGTPAALIYTPAANYNGADSFTYQAMSNGVASAVATVSITVMPVDDAPVATASTIATVEDVPVAITLAGTDIDTDVAQLRYSIFTAPAHGTLSGTPPNVTYTPLPDYNGTDSFQFVAIDVHSASAPATVALTIAPVNDAPNAADDYGATDPGRPLTFDVLANDKDAESDAMTIDSIDAAPHGTVELVANKLSYTPDAGFTGVDTFRYTVVDAHGAASTATVHMGVGTFPTGAPAEQLAFLDRDVSSSRPEAAPSVSADSRFIAFTTALPLVPEDTNVVYDVYLYDRGRRELKRISAPSDGTPINGGAMRASISANGRYVVYESNASNLVAGDTNGAMDVFRYDRTTGETIRVSVATGGGQASGTSNFARISDDGDTVAFLSDAFDLIGSDVNGAADVFVRKVSAGTTERVSVSVVGGDADLGSSSLALSGDGHWVAFASTATNLVAGDTNKLRDVFVRDLVHGTTTRVSVSSTGEEANNASTTPAISGDGRFVSFASNASNLVVGGNAATLAYVRDLTNQVTTRVSTFTISSWSWLSADGRYAVLMSSNPTSNGAQLVDRFASHTGAAGGSLFPMLCASGRYIVSAALPGAGNGILVVTPNPF